MRTARERRDKVLYRYPLEENLGLSLMSSALITGKAFVEPFELQIEPRWSRIYCFGEHQWKAFLSRIFVMHLSCVTSPMLKRR